MAGSSLDIEREKMTEYLIRSKRMCQTVGNEDRAIKRLVGLFEPRGAIVVEVGEGAIFQLGGVDIGRVEPGVAQADEFADGITNGLDVWVFSFGRFLAWGPGKWKSLEG
jgi:hypothetical protein